MSFINECKIIMPTCDKYLHLLNGNIFLIEHFWPEHPKIFVFGFTNPKIEFPNNRWEFVSLGSDVGKNNWSNDFQKFFDIKGDEIGEYFIHMNDDAPPLRRVNHELIEFIFEYMKTDIKIGKAGLSGNRGWSKAKGTQLDLYTPINDLKYKLGDVHQDGNYRISLANDIWKKEYFFKYMEPNLSSWQWETRHVKNDGYRILTTDQEPPIVFCHIYRASGTLNPYWYTSRVTDEFLPQNLIDTYVKLTKLNQHKGPILNHPSFSDEFYHDKKPWYPK
jgi:hypothetical protein